MKFTVRYIPLSSIKPDASVKMTDKIKRLQHLMWDCMNVLIVRRSKDDGRYLILSGLDRFEYLRKHTKNIYAPCIVDESTSSKLQSFFTPFRTKQPLDEIPMLPKSWSIARSFIKKEHRFDQLSRIEQIKVLFLAVQYKRTVKSSMKAMVNEMIKKKK